MKLSAVLAAVLLAASPAAAWTFVWRDATSHVVEGTLNKGCRNISHKKDKEFSWDRSALSDCCIRLYSKTGCRDQVGVSCPDWKKKASQNIKSFKVTNCLGGFKE